MRYKEKAEGNEKGIMRCGGSTFAWGSRTYIMGVVNLSPDSFSGDGCRSIDEALQQAVRFAGEGADIIDVGGESTRPGANPIEAEDEVMRVIPFIKELVKEVSVPVSIDTYKYEVARQALDAGAGMVNDISGLKMQPSMLGLVAGRQVPVVLTSNERGHPSDNVTETVVSSLRDLIKMALDAGIGRHNLVIDPGIGFGKTQGQNLEILGNLDRVKALGCPVLIGTSRKSIIRNVLGTDRQALLLGTAATVAIGIANGADIVRVHDVAEMSAVCRMCDAVIRGREGP